MAKKDYYADFRAMEKAEQRERILSVSSMCIDGAPRYLARWIETYLGATEDEQKARRWRAQ